MDPEIEEPEGATVTVEIPPVDDEPPAESAVALEAIQNRIEAVETRITEAVEGERQWTMTEISSLRETLENLRADLTQVTAGHPQQIAEIRAELTQLSQRAQPVLQPQEPEPEAVAIVVPPEAPESAEGTQPNVSATSAPPKGKRRVV